MQRIRKGDDVIVLAGRDKGKKGRGYVRIPKRRSCNRSGY